MVDSIFRTSKGEEKFRHQHLGGLTRMTTATENAFVDLSGISLTNHANPYNALIEASENDPVTPVSMSVVYSS